MLLELMSGGDLKAKLLRVRTLSPSVAAFYSACTAATLIHLRELNVIYRDLKPENLVIDHSGYLKLIDFGLSKVLTAADGRTWTLCGTPHFMAPEIIRGRGCAPLPNACTPRLSPTPAPHACTPPCTPPLHSARGFAC